MDRLPKLMLTPEILRAVNETSTRLSSFLAREFINKELHAPSAHLLKKPGKMLRPALVFMGSEYCGLEDKQELVELAMSIELLHVSSLIYDDMIDRDTKRRGIKSVHAKYGNETAMLAGNALIAKAIEKSAAYGAAAIKQTATAALEMCAGELLDYKYQVNRVVPSLRQYLETAELKSASLISAASSIAACYKRPRHTNSLAQFGRMFGLSFQIRDDILDFLEENEGLTPAFNSTSVFQPNVVRSIQGSGQRRREALVSAVSLNNRYIDDALKCLGQSRRSHIFSDYADLMRLEKSDVLR